MATEYNEEVREKAPPVEGRALNLRLCTNLLFGYQVEVTRVRDAAQIEVVDIVVSVVVTTLLGCSVEIVAFVIIPNFRVTPYFVVAEVVRVV